MQPNKTFTIAQLQALLIEHDDGVLKSGAHPEGRDFCAVEFINKITGKSWGDQNSQDMAIGLDVYCRRINDARWESDVARTNAMLPLLSACIGTANLKIDYVWVAEQHTLIVVPLAAKCAKYAAESAAKCAKYAAKYAAKCAAESAAKCAEYAAESAAESAESAKPLIASMNIIIKAIERAKTI